ncbi:MAG: hypothetical protein ABS79_00680 [Planctomycetes bacterium SCN 63-9]|nr:MAG: hypothetical protein ABS79_00680 [Planctomycetes bacterium SCN 63-9]
MSGARLTTISDDRGAPPRMLQRSIRGELDWIAMKALEKDRARRYQTAGALAADVARHLEGLPLEAGPPSARYRFRKFARRNRALLTTASLVAASLIAGTALSAWQAVRATRAERQSQAEFRRARETVDRIFTRVAEDLKKTPGMEEIQRALLEDALEFYQDFLAVHGDDPEVRYEAARAAHRVGSIHELIGQHHKVETPLRQAIGLLDKLVADAPREAAYRADLAECHSDLGAVFGISHRTREAIEERRLALAQYEQLVKDHPDDPAYRRKLASRRCNLGMQLSTNGEKQFQEAERHLRTALAAWEQIRANSPPLAGDDLELSRMHHWLGNLLIGTSRWDEGARELNAALAILARLHAGDRDDPELRARFAHAKSYLASLNASQGRLEEAERLNREAIALLDPIVAAHPKVIYYSRRLAIDCLTLGRTLWARGRIPDADAAFRKSLAIQERIIAEHPGADPYPAMLADLLFEYGLFLDEANRPQESADAFRRAIEMAEELAANKSQGIWGQSRLIRFLSLCPAPQFRDADRAIALAKEKLRKAPAVATYWALLGAAHYRRGDWNSAAEALNRAGEIDPIDPYIPLLLAMTRWQRGDREQARSRYEDAARMIDTREASDMMLRRLRREAAEMIEVRPPPVPKAK